jgi:hypothetical protein
VRIERHPAVIEDDLPGMAASMGVGNHEETGSLHPARLSLAAPLRSCRENDRMLLAVPVAQLDRAFDFGLLC